ncbi:flagellar assembly factor FliW [Natronobacillus azotifigens]|uniref:Flagellar assembly factor FliW n=1 Tax=Natronobacillus azotifigens TaxID=472978 RepID=A0A9J6R9X8_9BACI|nr:flagellar assembly protein FliW [Natronobacillus azotifigens]MCZ0702115.1 flagellar assembly protein FliW [Natronobacillus azotifigens]
MNIQTKYFGDVTIDQKQTIQFPQGIPGFQDETAFVLMDLPENPTFQVLQSTTRTNVAFIVTNPYAFHPDYELELDEATLELLQIEAEEQVSVFVILTLKDPFETSTVNLQAPIIVNHEKKYAKQFITNNSSYSTRAPLLPVKDQEG